MGKQGRKGWDYPFRNPTYFFKKSVLTNGFTLIKAIAEVQPNKYEFVYRWFVSQFPNYNELPELENGKLVAKVIDFIPSATKTSDIDLAA